MIAFGGFMSRWAIPLALAACASQEPAPTVEPCPDAAPPPDAAACRSCSALLNPIGNTADACPGTSEARLDAWLACACAGPCDACAGYCDGTASLAADGCSDCAAEACPDVYAACAEDDGP